MKNIKKILNTKVLFKVLGFVVILALIYISIYFDKEASIFIGGWPTSLIISWLFYQLGIKPFIKPQFKEKLIFEIVTKFIYHSGANLNNLKKESYKVSIEAELLQKLFPETFKFIKDYENKFNQLFTNCNISSNYAAFATSNELIFHKEATEKDKNKVAETRKKFIEKLNKTLYKDLKD